MAIFRSVDKGYRSLYQRISAIQNTDYETYTKKTKCDGQGNFKFTSLASGPYFVTTAIQWNAGNQPQGGSLMQRVEVEPGRVSEIVLSQ